MVLRRASRHALHPSCSASCASSARPSGHSGQRTVLLQQVLLAPEVVVAPLPVLRATPTVLVVLVLVPVLALVLVAACCLRYTRLYPWISAC